ncbi:MAG: TolC family protein [Bacteroidales bacterium]|nr:TolC family protein [Bacteroidales bacterium]
MNYKIVLIIAILALVQSSKAQKVWTLEECIQYAQSHNLDLKQNKLQLEIQEHNLARSRATMLPTLNANVNDVVNWGKSVDRYTNQFADTRTNSVNLYLQSSVTLFNGFKLLNSVKKNKLELAAQHYDLDYQEDMKAMDITTAFLQILYNKENLKNKNDQVSLTQMQVDRTQKLVDAGSAAKGDLYNIKSQMATEQAQKIESENILMLSILKIKQLMYLPGDTTFDISAPQMELVDGFGKLQDPTEVYQYALQNRPEIKSADMRVQSADKDLSISKGSISPNLNLSASLGSGYSGANSILDGNPVLQGYYPNGDRTMGGDIVMSPDFTYNTRPKAWDDQIIDNKNLSIGLYLSIPLFNGLQTHSNISQAKIAKQKAELNLENAKWQMRQTIEQAYADARSAYKQYEASALQVDALSEAFNYAEQRYDAKLITAFEYNDAKIKLDIATSEQLNAKYNYVFRVKVLDFYYGKPLKL